MSRHGELIGRIQLMLAQPEISDVELKPLVLESLAALFGREIARSPERVASRVVSRDILVLLLGLLSRPAERSAPVGCCGGGACGACEFNSEAAPPGPMFDGYLDPDADDEQAFAQLAAEVDVRHNLPSS